MPSPLYTNIDPWSFEFWRISVLTVLHSVLELIVLDAPLARKNLELKQSYEAAGELYCVETYWLLGAPFGHQGDNSPCVLQGRLIMYDLPHFITAGAYFALLGVQWRLVELQRPLFRYFTRLFVSSVCAMAVLTHVSLGWRGWEWAISFYVPYVLCVSYALSVLVRSMWVVVLRVKERRTRKGTRGDEEKAEVEIQAQVQKNSANLNSF